MGEDSKDDTAHVRKTSVKRQAYKSPQASQDHFDASFNR